jgi:hypothetical protein
MTEPFGTLERSLRAGPRDEQGYQFQALDLRDALGTAEIPDRLRRRADRERSSSGPRAMLAGPSFAAVLVVVIGLGGFALLTRQGGPSGVVPDASLSPAPSPATTVSPSPSPSLGSSPTPSPPPSSESSTATPVAIPPLTERFVSTRNGFSMLYAAGWVVTPATESWPQDIFLPLGHPALDQLLEPGRVRLVAASQLLGVGQTEDEWVASYFSAYSWGEGCVTKLALSPRLPIGGRSGYLDTAGCLMAADAAMSPGDVVYNAFVFAGDRVYQITLDGDVDLAYFEAILATVELDPASAIDPPPAS